MERRKILLGSGTALATVLAGCSSDETSGDDGNGDNGNGNGDNGNGNGDNGNGNGDNGNNGDNGDDGEPEIDDVPGFDSKKFEIASDAVTVEKIEHKDGKVDVVATTSITDVEKLFGELATLADDFDEAMVDLEQFAAKVNTVEWIVDHDGNRVVSFYVDVQWIVKYHDGELSADEILEKTKQTAE